MTKASAIRISFAVTLIFGFVWLLVIAHLDVESAFGSRWMFLNLLMGSISFRAGEAVYECFRLEHNSKQRLVNNDIVVRFIDAVGWVDHKHPFTRDLIERGYILKENHNVENL